MYSRISSAAVCGLEIIPITVETDVSDGLPQFIMVGYVSAQVREAEDRIRSAFRNCGIVLPAKRVTINMSPASLPKSGSLYDLPVALSLLASTGQLPAASLEGVLAAGELSLSGDVNSVNGILPIAVTARDKGIRTLIIPASNRSEGLAISSSIHVVGVHTLKEAADYLRKGVLPARDSVQEAGSARAPSPDEDFRDIRGQGLARRAAEISAAGFHNLLLAGPPGSGKSMLARRMPSILPAMTEDEQLEVSAIYSIAGLLDPASPLVERRPYRHPHHTISPQALAGGGRIPQPGEITLAHRGILFLDELPEFQRRSMEILRQPLEDREIVISRTAGSFHFPANFLLLAAMNRCPCGMYPDQRCTCTPREIHSYMNRISRPLLDRIDLYVECPPVTYGELTGDAPCGDSSADIRQRAEAARRIAAGRFRGTPLRFNSDIPAGSIREFCPMEPEAEQRLEKVYSLFGLSARGYHRLMKTARTIADLEASPLILRRHIDEALVYRIPAAGNAHP